MRAADARMGRRSLVRGENQLSWDGVEILGIPVVYFQIVLILIIGVVALIVIFTDAQAGRRSSRTSPLHPSRYLQARHILDTLAFISSNQRCTIDSYNVSEFSRDSFTTRYYNSRPVLVQLNDSHQEVVGADKLHLNSLWEDYGTWVVRAVAAPSPLSPLHPHPSIPTLTMETFLRDHLHNDDPRHIRQVLAASSSVLAE